MTSDNVFGSDQLTPELLRSAAFAEEGGRVDVGEVRTFLDRVASSLEVFMSGDAPTALRAEFDRNASIATQILDAGQTASEQLRRQAAEEAKRILDEAREATLGLRETVEVEIEQARTQVEAMRGTFIQDLRDLYDRIGASLYRFERAAEESAVAPIQEPTRAHEPAASAPETEFRNERGTSHSFSADVSDVPAPAPAAAPAPSPVSGPGARRAGERPEDRSEELPDLPEGAKPPAWQQLPPQAWQATAAGDDPLASAPATGDVDAPQADAPTPAPEVLAEEVPADVAPPTDPFAPVVEDEPLAPGEPLVDLRGFGAAVEGAPTNVTETGGSWLDSAEDLPPAVAQAGELPPTAPQAAAGEPGGWLDTPLDPDPAAGTPADPALARDDALANALIGAEPVDTDAGAGDATAAAGDAPADGSSPDPFAATQPAPPADSAPAPVPDPAPMAFPTAGASPDAVAVRQLILDSLASGQTRETVEAYLREHMGLLEPGALVDAALSSVDQP
ncbi:MAG: hypothetical protein JWL76_74 [Thermoleophilia bacterium]|nr:hypothetical protein [Thermoleophilia bacterium]